MIQFSKQTMFSLEGRKAGTPLLMKRIGMMLWAGKEARHSLREKLARLMVHEAEDSFLKQDLDDANQAICKGIIHPVSSATLTGKYSPVSSSFLPLHLLYSRIPFPSPMYNWITRFENTGKHLTLEM